MSIHWTRRGILKLLGAGGIALAARLTGVLPELGAVLPTSAQAGKPGVPAGVDNWWAELGFGGHPTMLEGADLDQLRRDLVGAADVSKVASHSKHKDLLKQPMHAGVYQSTSGVTLTVAAIAQDDHLLLYHELSQPHSHFKRAVQLVAIDASNTQANLIELAYNGQHVDHETATQGGIIEAEASSCGNCTSLNNFTGTTYHACAWDWSCLRDYCGFQGGPCWLVCLLGPPACISCAAVWCSWLILYGCVSRWCSSCTTCYAR